MNRTELFLKWSLPFMALVCMLCSVNIGMHWRESQRGENAAVRNARTHLATMLVRERAFFEGNHAYAIDPEELGLEAIQEGDWRYLLTATTISRRPILLLEADNGKERLCLDSDGRFHRSSIKAIPSASSRMEDKGDEYASLR